MHQKILESARRNTYEKISLRRLGGSIDRNHCFSIQHANTITPTAKEGTCPNCGADNLVKGVTVHSVEMKGIRCPSNPDAPWHDQVIRYEVYEAEDCESCDYHKQLGEVAPKWTVLCNEYTKPKPYTGIPGAKTEQGHDPHQCI